MHLSSIRNYENTSFINTYERSADSSGQTSISQPQDHRLKISRRIDLIHLNKLDRIHQYKECTSRDCNYEAKHQLLLYLAKKPDGFAPLARTTSKKKI